MEIGLNEVGKRFQKHWIFRNVTYKFSLGNSCALLGANGSGKSTLLRLIAGMQSPTKGTVTHQHNGKIIPVNQLYQYISFSAPGQEIIEEMLLEEFLEFHFTFKPMLPNITVKDIIAIIGLQKAAQKQIGDFSSGMKQRVKLAQAIFTNTPLLLLDEPCTNLDQKGVEQYREWIEQFTANRLVIVASNDPREYYFCQEQIDIADYK